LPKSLTGVFQGLLLFTLLACDTLIAYRIRWISARTTASPSAPVSAQSQSQSQSQSLDDAPLNPVVASSTLPARGA
ncbi:MAG TPA: hypothetical protein VF308_14230, partial [Caldimonas sp.]